MNHPLRILMLEDSSSDAELIKHEISEQNIRFIDNCVDSREEFTSALFNFNPDIILSDYNLFQFNALDALSIMKDNQVKVPFILVTGSQTEEIAVKCIQEGADDYILKTSLTRLPSAIRHTLSKKRIESEKTIVENDLRDTRDLLHHIISSSPAVTFLLGINEKNNLSIKWVSENLDSIFDYNIREILNIGWWRTNIHPEDKDGAIAKVKELLKKGSVSHDYRFKLKNGNYCWIHDEQKVVYKKGKPYEIVGTWTNINDKKEVELALIESQKQYKNLVENITEVIFSADASNMVTYISPAVYSLLQYSPADLINKNILEIVHPADKLLVSNYFNHQNLSDKSALEFRLFSGGKKIRWVRCSINPVYSDSKLTGFSGILADITEKKLSEFALRNAKEKAEELNRLKSNFLAAISHELRTPMIGILGCSEFLEEDLSDPGLKNMASTIMQSGKRLMTTLNLLIDLSRLENGDQSPKYSDFDIVQTCKIVYRNFKKEAKEKGLIFSFTSPYKAFTVSLEERFCFAILENILSNAIKFTLTGSITLDISSEKINGVQNAVIKVTDTGIGIPEEKIPLIFEEFRQISEGYTRSFEGTGLGLSITKKYVQKMNGTIDVRSKIGMGTTITVTLPLASCQIIDANVSKEEKPLSAGPTGSKEHVLNILLIDDDHTIPFLLQKYLSPHNITHFFDADSGILAANNDNYELVLLDINLRSKLDGIMVLKEIRKNPIYLNIPFIAITAFAMKGDKERFLDNGFNNYVAKPFDRRQLLNVVSLYI